MAFFQRKHYISQIIVVLSSLALAYGKPGVFSQFAATPGATPFAGTPVATPFAATPVATPFATAPVSEAYFGYGAPQAPLAYSPFYGNSASQVDFRQNFNAFPYSVPAVSPLSYTSPVAHYPSNPFGAPLKYAPYVL